MKISRGALFLAGAVVACAAWLIFYAAGTFQRAADTLMQREVERGHFSGTVLISRGAKALFAKAYGPADADWAATNPLGTKFQRIVAGNLTVIVRANNVASDPKRIAQSLSALALGEHFVPSFDRETVELAPEVLQRIAGDYELGGETYTITVRDGKLYVKVPDHPELPEVQIRAASDTELFLPDMDGDLTVTEDAHGRVTGFIFAQGNSSRIVRKIR